MAITHEQIYTIANTLNAQGMRPTLAAVRRMLGAGSFTTISEALNEWKLMQSADAGKHAKETTPEHLIERLHTFGSALWLDAMSLATNRFTLDREAIEEKNREKEIYYNELEGLSAEYDQELDGAKACIEELRHELLVANQRIAANKEDRQRLSQGLSDSETARKTAEHRSTELRLELDRSHQKSDQLQNSFMELAGKLESIQLQLQEKHTQKKRVDRNNLAEEVRSE